MKIVVYPHDLKIGGSQLNAIEIAAQVQSLGHACVVFGYPGPLMDRIAQLGLEFIASPEPGKRPSPAVMIALGRLVEEREIDVVHGYEWPPAVESWLVAARQRRSVAAVGTVMSMAVAPFLPRTLPLVVGTEQIASAERAKRRRLIAVIEPPVDVQSNAPRAARGVDDFRSQHGMNDGSLNVVSVSRLAHELKLEGLLVAIDTLPKLGGQQPIRLVIVGDGPARELVAARAEAANRDAGRTAVVLTGELPDPRPAYDAADILLGMGGSALRSLAFAKPLVVQGENGFWRLLSDETVDEFLWTGWYGVGTGPENGPSALRNAIGPLLNDIDRRRELGKLGRELVEQRFGLKAAAARQLRIYQAALDVKPDSVRLSIDGVRSAVNYTSHVASRRIARIRGRHTIDDFNRSPVVATGPRRPVAMSR